MSKARDGIPKDERILFIGYKQRVRLTVKDRGALRNVLQRLGYQLRPEMMRAQFEIEDLLWRPDRKRKEATNG
ncbi:MAG: hypothetical protein DMG06_04790 [Acidobacteria bacterium]|nr:MAG: hypothetical protein DMG06_04790 [Acidobacteriota bacterium]